MKIIRWLLSHSFLILLIVIVIYGYMFWGNLLGKDTPAGKAIAYLSSEFVVVEDFVNAVKAKHAETQTHAESQTSAQADVQASAQTDGQIQAQQTQTEQAQTEQAQVEQTQVEQTRSQPSALALPAENKQISSTHTADNNQQSEQATQPSPRSTVEQAATRDRAASDVNTHPANQYISQRPMQQPRQQPAQLPRQQQGQRPGWQPMRQPERQLAQNMPQSAMSADSFQNRHDVPVTGGDAAPSAVATGIVDPDTADQGNNTAADDQQAFISPEIEKQLSNVDEAGRVIHAQQTEATVKTEWVTARKAFYQRNYELSEKNYQKVIDNTEDNFDAYGELGNVYFNQGKRQEAASAYFEAAAILVHKGQVNRARSLIGLLRHLDKDKAVQLQKLIESATTDRDRSS